MQLQTSHLLIGALVLALSTPRKYARPVPASTGLTREVPSQAALNSSDFESRMGDRSLEKRLIKGGLKAVKKAVKKGKEKAEEVEEEAGSSPPRSPLQRISKKGKEKVEASLSSPVTCPEKVEHGTGKIAWGGRNALHGASLENDAFPNYFGTRLWNHMTWKKSDGKGSCKHCKPSQEHDGTPLK